MKTLLKLFLITLSISLSWESYSQQGVLSSPYYISGAAAVGKGDRSIPKPGALLEIGKDTSDGYMYPPRVLAGSGNAPFQKGAFAIDITDGMPIFYTGTEWFKPGSATINYVSADSNTVPTGTNTVYIPTQTAQSYDNFLNGPGAPLFVTAADSASGEVRFVKGATYWSKVIIPSNLTNYIPKSEVYITIKGKNLMNPANQDTTKYYSPGGGALNNSLPGNLNAFGGYIPVTPGLTYTYSGTDIYNVGGYFNSATTPLGINVSFTTLAGGGYKFTVPIGSNITYVGLNFKKPSAGPGINAMLELGSTVTTFQPYVAPYNRIDTSKFEVPVIAKSVAQPAVDRVNDAFQLLPKKNLVDTTAWNRNAYYSPNSKNMSGFNASIGATAFIPVVPGGVYSVSNSGFGNNSGGYFNRNKQTLSTNIVFSPVLSGQRFTVPNDTTIKYVVINWSKTDTSVPRNFQIEASEIVTAYEPYQTQWKLNPSYNTASTTVGTTTPSGSTSLGLINEMRTVNYPGVWKKFPRFTSLWNKRDTDVVFAIWGTSMVARTTNTSFRSDGPTRPPLADAGNVFSHLVDKLMWAGQQYRRFDHPTYFTSSGTFTATYNDNAWDDGSYREGRTNISTTTNAKVDFTVPIGAWQYNFIYRTDTTGTTGALISVAEGNGLMEVFDGTNWVEANNYTFSMREPGTTAYKGNTTFQKRVKMRCKSSGIDSRGIVKTVSISNSHNNGRFMYWGTEWSERRTMITFINAARGSHNFTSPSTGLPKFQDNELYGFNPDFLLIELPTNNEGASLTSIPNKSRTDFVNVMENWIYNSSNPQSVYSKTSGFTTCELAIFNTTASVAINIIDTATKEWLFANEKGTGEKITVADVYRAVSQWMLGKDNQTATVNLFEEMNRDAMLKYGSYYDGFLGSGATGTTFTKDGTHWNDVGSKEAARYLLPLFDFN